MLHRLFYAGPSIDTLHEEYAKKGRIDDQAPVQAVCDVHVDAPVERVWQILSDPTGWPDIDPDIHDVRLDSEVGTDSRFTWANGKARMKSRFAVLDPGREVTWTGTSSGAKAVHRHLLETVDGGGTRLRCEESMAGPLLVVFFNSSKLHAGLVRWLGALKAAAERS